MSYDVSGLGLSGGKTNKRKMYMWLGIAVAVIVVVVIGVWYAFFQGGT